jgi:ABC-type glycerol-3-phosphate transport system substrate-binding protein
MVRKFFLTLTALLMLLPLGLGAQEAPVLVEVGHMSLSSKMLPWFMQEVDAFMAANPGIEVSVRDFNEPGRSSVMLKDVPNLAANIITIDPWSGYEVSYLASRDLIVPVDDFLPDPEFSLDVFYPNLFENVLYDGKTWGIPFTTETLVLAYKPTMLAEAGIENPPATWDELKADVEKLTVDKDGDGTPEQYGYGAMDQGRAKVIWGSMVLQLGGTFFTGGQPDFLSAPVRQAMNTYRDIVLAPGTLHPWFATQAPYAMEIVGWRSFEERVKYDKDVALAPLPAYEHKALVPSHGTFLAVRRSTPEREAASWKLIKWLSRKDMPLPSGNFGLGCRTDIVTHPELLARSGSCCQNWQELYTSKAYIAKAPTTDLVGAQLALACLDTHFVRSLQQHTDLDKALAEAASEAATHLQPLVISEPAGYDVFH